MDKNSNKIDEVNVADVEKTLNDIVNGTNIAWGEVIYDDCMNPKNGLPTFEDKSVELGFADPPFNIDFESKLKKTRKTKTRYDDDLSNDDYAQWCLEWFTELERVCEMVILHVGKPNMTMWYKITNPKDYFVWYKKNQSLIGCKSAYLCKSDPFLMYGKLKNGRRLSWDVLEVLMNTKKEVRTIHPCPLSEVVMTRILKELRPKSVLDPFLGSGTMIESAMKLRIKWAGFEIDETYSVDINTRIKRMLCMSRRSQRTLL